MTVCIAAIADSGKKIVLAADNMLTISIGNSIQYQKENDDHKKIVKLNDNVYALFAGALHVMSPMVVAAEEKIKSNTNPEKAANVLREELQNFALQKIEEEILKKVGLNWDIFRNRQNTLNQEIVKDLYAKISGFNLDINITIAGYDKEKNQCYLSSVIGNGVLIETTLQGFTTNGSGGDLAKFSLILSNYKQSFDVEIVKELVKKAVIDAKKSPGVGDLGDFYVIPNEGDMASGS